MEYMGPADYHFWNGVNASYKDQDQQDCDSLAPSFTINNQVTRDCLEAFKWGFCLGLELTKDEYIELTTYPKKLVDKTHKIVVKSLNEPKDESDFKTTIKITGNC